MASRRGSRAYAIETMSSRSTQTRMLECPVCHATATMVVRYVTVGPWGGSWISIPQGWWFASGVYEQDIRSGVRCPKCMAKPDKETGEP